MRKHRRMTSKQRREMYDIMQGAFALVFSIVFLLFCIFGKQILMIIGGVVCVLALMYAMRKL